MGMKRNHNEDNFAVIDEDKLYIVADGMGGHASGEVASQMAIETVSEFFRSTSADLDATWPYKMDHSKGYEENRLITGIKLANLRIHQTAQANAKLRGMGTTLVSVLVVNEGVIVGHVGDSRVYRMRSGVLQQLTEDHSLLNDYRRMKEMSGEEVENFPHKNVVVRALGLAEQVYVDILVDEYQRDDVFLLCSDGLCGMLDDETMLATATRFSSIDTATNTLVKQANDAGGNDNITALLVRIEA